MRLRWLSPLVVSAGCFVACASEDAAPVAASPAPVTRDAGASSPQGPGPSASIDWPPEAGPVDAGDDADAAPVLDGPCDLPAEQTGYVGSQSLPFAGAEHTYELYVADRYDGHTRFPVVFVFHGDGGTGAIVRSWLTLEGQSDGKAIFVYPDGPNKSWDTFTPPGMNSDYDLVDAILDDVSAKLCVDHRRVFAWGISRGAFFVNHLGCYRGDRFRGIIANSGGGPSSKNPDDRDEHGFFKCPTPPVAALVIHSDTDKTVDFSAGVDSMTHWRTANGCAATSQPIDPSPCVLFDGCERPVEWCHLHGRDHGVWTPTMRATWAFVEANP